LSVIILAAPFRVSGGILGTWYFIWFGSWGELVLGGRCFAVSWRVGLVGGPVILGIRLV
jgi:hypothetical protein